MADFPERLQSVKSDDELEKLLSEIARRGADGWRRRHVERHLPSDYEEVLDRWTDAEGRVVSPDERGRDVSVKGEHAGCGRIVRWVRGRVKDRDGLASLRELWTRLGSYEKTYQDFIEAIGYCVEEEVCEGIVIVKDQIVVLRDQVDPEFVRQAVVRSLSLPQYAISENEKIGNYRGLLNSAWGAQVDRSVCRHGVRSILASDRHVGALCYIALARREEAGSVSQITEKVNELSTFEWPEAIIRERLVEDWRFWPVGSDGYILSDDRTKGRPPDGGTQEIARRLLATVSESVVKHSDTGESPLELDLKWDQASRLRCYLHWVEESSGSSTRYYTSVRAEKDENGRIAFDRSDGRIAVVCGYCESENVFVFWDAGLLEGYRDGHSVSVGSGTVFGALVEGITTECRNLKKGEEFVVAGRAGKVEEALEKRIEADRERLLEDEYTIEYNSGGERQQGAEKVSREEDQRSENGAERDLSWRDRGLGNVEKRIMSALTKSFPNALTISELTKRVRAGKTGSSKIDGTEIRVALKGPLYRHVRQMSKEPEVWVLKTKSQRDG